MAIELTQTLVRMAEEDKRVRAELAATGELYQGYAPRMAEVHQRHARQLETLIDQFGWPGKSLVGVEGSHAAWLVLQHAIGSPELQRKCVPLLAKAVALQDAEPTHLAYLEDRICFFERRPQRYGTQFDWDENDQMTPWKIEDPEQVDEYRRHVGLEPLAEKIEQPHKGTEGEVPPDFKARQKEQREWAKSVGWL